MNKTNSNETIIFTDGASRGNPGPGGWGAVVVTGGSVIERGGRRTDATNNRMELMAVIDALSFCAGTFAPDPAKNSIVIYTDSSYVLKGATKWLFDWEAKNWRTTAKKEVLNKDLWQELSHVINLTTERGKKIDWRLVSGHVGVVGNERADEIAVGFADNREPKLFSGPLSKYGIDILNVSHNTERKENRLDLKTRSRAKAYSYISKVGDLIKIHPTWEECEKRVKGTAGALYKKALNPEEEKEIIMEFKNRNKDERIPSYGVLDN